MLRFVKVVSITPASKSHLSRLLSDRAGCDDGLDALRMSSITYRIATGAQAGRKVATLQTIPADNGSPEGDAGKVGGFLLHAGSLS